MASRMSQQTLKKRTVEDLRILQSVWKRLVYEFEQLEPDCNVYMADKYPFDGSFDEMEPSVSEWCDNTIENLNCAIPLRLYEVKFYRDPLKEVFTFVREIKAENDTEAIIQAKKIAEETETYYTILKPVEEEE